MTLSKVLMSKQGGWSGLLWQCPEHNNKNLNALFQNVQTRWVAGGSGLIWQCHEHNKNLNQCFISKLLTVVHNEMNIGD